MLSRSHPSCFAVSPPLLSLLPRRLPRAYTLLPSPSPVIELSFAYRLSYALVPSWTARQPRRESDEHGSCIGGQRNTPRVGRRSDSREGMLRLRDGRERRFSCRASSPRSFPLFPTRYEKKNVSKRRFSSPLCLFHRARSRDGFEGCELIDEVFFFVTPRIFFY